MMKLPFHWASILLGCLRGTIETNTRTGSRVKIHKAVGVSFSLDLSDNILPTIGFRKTFPRSAAAEVAWFLQGDQDARFIQQYAPLWSKFIEPLGGGGALKGVKAAYGYRWRRHFGRDQIACAIKALRDNPTDRRVYVSAWDPAQDGLGAKGQKNVPCPTSFTLSIVGNRLYSSLFIRSSDVFVGLPYDIMGHALLMKAFAVELGVSLGSMQVTCAHAHLYEAHWDMAQEALRQEVICPEIHMPDTWSVSRISQDPHTYVAIVHNAQTADGVKWPSYNPKPEVIE